MTKLTTNRNYKAVAGAAFAFLVCAGSFVPTPVYADFGSAELWSLVNAGLVSSPAVTALKNSVVEQYTSLSPGELAVLEYEAGAMMAVGSVVLAQDWFSEYGIEFNSLSSSYCLSGLACYTDSNNLRIVTNGLIFCTPDVLILNSDAGQFGVIPTVLNGRSVSTGVSVSNTNPAFSYTYWNLSSGSDCQLALSASGIIDSHTGVGTWLSSYSNPQFALAGMHAQSDWSWVTPLNASNLIWWSSNYTYFAISYPKYVLNYCNRIDFTDISEPIDLYNQAYNKALEDYPQYIDIWVDLDDEFTAETPSVFDSLEFPPYIPEVDFHDVDIPDETLPSGLTDGAGFWFSAFSNMVDAFNLKPFVILFLCIMLAMVILKI